MEVAEAQARESALALKNCQGAMSGLSALRRQHSRLEKEYASAYGLVAQQNAFSCQLLEKYQDFRSVAGTLGDPRTPVVYPDRHRESVPFDPQPPFGRQASGSGSSAGVAGLSTAVVGSSSAEDGPSSGGSGSAIGGASSGGDSGA